MANLSTGLGFVVGDDITLVRFNEYKKIIKAKERALLKKGNERVKGVKQAIKLQKFVAELEHAIPVAEAMKARQVRERGPTSEKQKAHLAKMRMKKLVLKEMFDKVRIPQNRLDPKSYHDFGAGGHYDNQGDYHAGLTRGDKVTWERDKLTKASDDQTVAGLNAITQWDNRRTSYTFNRF